MTEQQKIILKRYRTLHKEALLVYERERKAKRRLDPSFREAENRTNYASLIRRKEFQRLNSISV